VSALSGASAEAEVGLAIRARLPAAVFDLALRLGARPAIRPAGVTLCQTGRMLTRIGGSSWISFTAVQTIPAVECARARKIGRTGATSLPPSKPPPPLSTALGGPCRVTASIAQGGAT
jgi:hypothetical protein